MKIRPKRMNKRIIIVFASILVLGAVVIAVLLFLLKPTAENDTANTNSPAPASQPQSTTVKLAAMGDMLAHDTIINNAKSGNTYDFGRYFQHIRTLYDDADLVFCNQEGPSAGPAYGISGYPVFNAPTEFSDGLKSDAGCNLINLANNHLGDKGVAATNQTIANWQRLNPLAATGANQSSADQKKVALTEVNGIKFSLLGFADFNNNRSTPSYSVNLYHDTALVQELVKSARANSDVVVVSMHWGTEDSPQINADQRAQVAKLASLGVDLVIGTGPHVLQPVEVVSRPDGGDMVVWYSLGNMLSSQLYIPQLFSGIATMDIKMDPSTQKISIENLGFIPTYMHYEWTAAEEAASLLLARRNPMIYPLSEAAVPLAKSNNRTTVEAQRNYIISILGDKVTVQ